MKKNKTFMVVSHNSCHVMKDTWESKNNSEVTGELRK